MNLDLFSQYLEVRPVLSWALVTACMALVVFILPKAGIEQRSWESYMAVNGREGMGDQGQLLKWIFILHKVKQKGTTMLVDISLRHSSKEKRSILILNSSVSVLN